MVRIVPYGGVGEIGGNKLLVESEDGRLLLDFGMSFGAHGDYFAEFLQPRTTSALRDMLELGLLPPIDGIYRSDLIRPEGIDDHLGDDVEELWEVPVRSYDAYVDEHGEPAIDGIVLSHAHKDHFGRLGYVDPRIPVVCTSTTKAMLAAIETLTSESGADGEVVAGSENIVRELKGGNFPGHPTGGTGDEWTRTIQARPPYEPFELGGFEVELIPVDHSVPGSASAWIEAPDGTTIYYTGDIRFHGIYDDVTAKLRDRLEGAGPDVMLCEGTRIDDEEPDSEAKAREGIRDEVEAADGLAMVDFGWKDTTRFETVQKVAEATGREFLVSHKLAYLLHEVAKVDPRVDPIEAYDNVAVYLARRGAMIYDPADYNRGSSERLRLGYWDADWAERDDEVAMTHHRNGRTALDIREDPEDYLVMLSQWDMNELLDLDPPPGSRYVRCACEPFSDEMEIDLQRQANWLKEFGIPVREETSRRGEGTVELPTASHASGHASGPHLKEFVKRVDPETIVPVHTEREDIFQETFDGVVEPTVGEPIEV